MPDKLTDSEITIKALEGMIQFAEMVDRDVIDMVDVQTLKNTLDLINRLQAENERLNEIIENKGGSIIKNTAKTEAYKEFAERLEAEYTDFDKENEVILPENLNKAINDLLKELVGEDDG